MIVIYHASCVDGFTAAYAAWLKYRDDAQYIPAHYGDDPPDVTGQDVLIVDFSYPRETLLRMRAAAKSLTVLDHHRSAQAELDGLDFCHFDMDRSGASMTWQCLWGLNLPSLVKYVEDRDLWRWDLFGSREVSAYIATVERTFLDWNMLDEELQSPGGINRSIEKGAVALRVVEQYVAAQATRAGKVKIGGHRVPCINTTFATSELVGNLAERAPFAAGWFRREDGRFVYSLRSRGDDGIDVSEIAQQYGGGGHRNAAGFTSEVLL